MIIWKKIEVIIVIISLSFIMLLYFVHIFVCSHVGQVCANPCVKVQNKWICVHLSTAHTSPIYDSNDNNWLF